MTARLFTILSITVSDFCKIRIHKFPKLKKPYVSVIALLSFFTNLLVVWFGLTRLLDATDRSHFASAKYTHRQSTDGQCDYGDDDFPRVRGAETAVSPEVLGHSDSQRLSWRFRHIFFTPLLNLDNSQKALEVTISHDTLSGHIIFSRLLCY